MNTLMQLYKRIYHFLANDVAMWWVHVHYFVLYQNQCSHFK